MGNGDDMALLLEAVYKAATRATLSRRFHWAEL
jgi:hypothetical protein